MPDRFLADYEANNRRRGHEMRRQEMVVSCCKWTDTGLTTREREVKASVASFTLSA